MTEQGRTAMRRRTVVQGGGDGRASEFLRSINVRFDADVPGRVAHFRPTAKGLQLVRTLFGDGPDRACVIVAPYGSGKSLAATYLLQVVENRADARTALEQVGRRLSAVSPELHESVRSRIRRKQKGIALALHGYA